MKTRNFERVEKVCVFYDCNVKIICRTNAIIKIIFPFFYWYIIPYNKITYTELFFYFSLSLLSPSAFRIWEADFCNVILHLNCQTVLNNLTNKRYGCIMLQKFSFWVTRVYISCFIIGRRIVASQLVDRSKRFNRM